MSNDKKPTQEQLDAARADTQEHIDNVRRFLGQFIAELHGRGEDHDASKLGEPELSMFAYYGPLLSTLTYGSEEYKAALAEMKEQALDHHYAANRHHPEHAFADEEWLPIEGFVGYEVSNLGRVRSLDRMVPREGKQGDLSIKGQTLKAGRTPKGYRRIQLVSADGSKRNFMVHRLVALAFIENPDEKPEVNHKNGDKENNKASNLEWSTESENQFHAYATGLRKPSAKYVVFCDELGLETVGCSAMERELKAQGYAKAKAGAIWRCIHEPGAKHMDLEFHSQPIESSKAENGIAGMNLVDLMEMLCDWKAASMRMKDGGDIRESIAYNAKRFDIPEPIVQLLLNSVGLLRVGLPWGKSAG